jgi:hypothetical protein
MGFNSFIMVVQGSVGQGLEVLLLLLLLDNNTV